MPRNDCGASESEAEYTGCAGRSLFHMRTYVDGGIYTFSDKLLQNVVLYVRWEIYGD